MSDFNQFSAKRDTWTNRKKYDKLSITILNKIPDDKIEQAIMDYLFDKKIKNNQNDHEIIKDLSKGFQYIYTTWKLEEYIDNGGFNQYLYITEGRFLNELIDGLNKIKAFRTRKVVMDVLKVFNEEILTHSKTKETGTSRAYFELYKSAKLNKLDDKFYETDENLSELRIAYIRKNLNEFITI
ncbi:MAG: DUF4375 domain-containing protein [Promethearchaeota archaeon]